MKPLQMNIGPLALAALVGVIPVSLAAQNANPWNPNPAPLAIAAPVVAPQTAPQSKYYQPAPAVPAPASVAATQAAPSRYAPDNLEQQLSLGRTLLPAEQQSQAQFVAGTNPFPAPLAPNTQFQNPYANARQGYGYPQGFGNTYNPGYGAGAPIGSTGFPGNFDSFMPFPGNFTNSGFPGSGFSPFGFW